MRIFNRHLFAGLLIGLATIASSHDLAAQRLIVNTASLALKSGETAEIRDLYWVINCQSMLKGLPEATILEGPPGVTVKVVEAKVMARAQRCAKPVAGAKLMISAKDIEDFSVSQLIVRFTYHTRDGTRQFSETYNLSLIP
jgi:hypothetical protein